MSDFASGVGIGRFDGARPDDAIVPPPFVLMIHVVACVVLARDSARYAEAKGSLSREILEGAHRASEPS